MVALMDWLRNRHTRESIASAFQARRESDDQKDHDRRRVDEFRRRLDVVEQMTADIYRGGENTEP